MGFENTSFEKIIFFLFNNTFSNILQELDSKKSIFLWFTIT